MNNNTNTRDEVLSSIGSLNSVVMESQLEILLSLTESADKAVMLMENYSGDDLDMFAIFQEAEESAVQQGDPATNNSADAKKKNDSFFMKILMFIPNVLRKLWQFIKDSWNGVIVPKAEDLTTGVSDKTAALLDKISGKDESWIKEHAAELGIGAGALSLVLGIVGIINRDKLMDVLTNWHTAIKALYVGATTAPSIAFQNGSIVTNIKFEGLTDTVKKYMETSKSLTTLLKAIATKGISVSAAKQQINDIIANIDSYQKAYQQDPFISGTPAKVTGDELIASINNIADILKDPPVDNFDFDASKITFDDKPDDPLYTADVNTVKTNVAEAGKKLSPITRFIQATSNAVRGILDWIRSLFGKTKELDNELAGSGTPENTNTESGAAENAEAPQPENSDTGGNDAAENNDIESDIPENTETPQPENDDIESGTPENTDTESGTSEGKAEHKKGDTLTADEAFQFISSRGLYKDKIELKNNAIYNKHGKIVSPSFPAETGPDGKTFTKLKYRGENQYVLEYATDEGLEEYSASSWYRR